MQNPDLQPKMVGREDELKELQTYLDKAIEGEGNTIFLCGEAGIGKTRLVNELKQIAQTRGFQVLSGNSMYESLTPFMPIFEALRSGGLESLFAEEAPRVEAVYLVTNTGLLIREVVREETELNPDLFISMFTTVTDFLNESLSKLSGEEEKGTLNSLGYQNYRILIERHKDINLVVILTGRENEFLLNDMGEILLKITKTFKRTLKEWGGDEKKVAGIEGLLKPLITSGKYDGIYYGKEDPKARRNLLFENVSMGLARSSQTSPTLLCIEDLQWADPSSLALMHYLARNTRGSGLLIFGTYRPEGVAAMDGKGHPLVGTMQLMDREDLYEKMELERLPEESINEFLFALLGRSDFTEDFKNKLYKETEGNPLFVIELVKFLIDEEIIQNIDGTWKLAKELVEGIIPSKVYNVISRRLTRMEKNDRKVLDYASNIGEAFNYNLLAAILDMNRIQLLERLRYIEETHRLIHPQNGNFKFDHAKIKEVLYNEIPEQLRIEYHLKIANSIEKLNKDNMDEVIEDLAFHYYQCKNREKALIYLIKAAEKAKKEYANEEALGLYQRAIEVEEDEHRKMEILTIVGDIYYLIGDFNNSLSSYKSAIKLTTNDKKKAGIMAKMVRIYEDIGDYEESINTCKKALDLVNDEDCKEKALILNNVSLIYHKRGEWEKEFEQNLKSLEIFEKIGDRNGIASSLMILHSVHVIRGEFSKAFEKYSRALKIFEEMGDQKGIAGALKTYGNMLMGRDEYEKALESYIKCMQISERIGDKKMVGIVLNNIGLLHVHIQEFDKALEYLERSLDVGTKIWNLSGNVMTLNSLGDAYNFIGEYDLAIDQYKKSLELCNKMNLRSTETCNYNGLAEVYYNKGDLKKALRFCNMAYNLSSEIGAVGNKANSRKVLGMIYREQENWTESYESFMECIRILKERNKRRGLGECHYEFGMMWKAKGDPNKAKEQLEKAYDLFEELKLKKKVNEIKTQLELL